MAHEKNHDYHILNPSVWPFLGALFGPVDFGPWQPLHTWSPTGAWSDLIAAALHGSVAIPALLILVGYLLLCSAIAVLGYRRVQQTVYR